MKSFLWLWLKKIAARLPEQWQKDLKQKYYRRQILRDQFKTSEPEYEILSDFISAGDWVVDIGANVGHYTKRFSELVGEQGRVIAFEPVPSTFALLAANVELFADKNVTLINAAVSDKTDIAGISIPKFSTGLTNYFQAHIAAEQGTGLSVLSFSLDSFCINRKIGLVKIDAEGHELFVIKGMLKLLELYQPVLIVETDSPEVVGILTSIGYISKKMQDSPNILFVFDQ